MIAEESNGKKAKILQQLWNFVLFVYKTQMSCSERAFPFRDLPSSLLSDTDYPPHPLFLRNHKLRGNWWNPKHEVVTGLSKPSLDFNLDSLLAGWLTFSLAFTQKNSSTYCLQLIGGRGPHFLHPNQQLPAVFSSSISKDKCSFELPWVFKFQAWLSGISAMEMHFTAVFFMLVL